MVSPALTAENRRRPCCGRPLYSLTFLLLPVFLAAAPAFCQVKAVKVSGGVEARPGTAGSWDKVAVNAAINNGSEIKTGWRGRVTLDFEDGSKVELGPRSSFIVEQADRAKASLKLKVGRMKAWVSKFLSRRFRVRTPTAVCSVRGTEFDLDVHPSGDTDVKLKKGLMGVADNQGNEVLMKGGQQLGVTSQGLGNVGSLPTQDQQNAQTRQAMRREMGLEMSKDEVQAMAAIERKNAVYQSGKALVDVNGFRVRLESYIIRSAENQFKFVVLNDRDARFDYFFYVGTFNDRLPEDLSIALKQTSGCVGAPCQYWLTSYRIGRSNTQDHLVEDASGGHLVDLNNNQVEGDEVTKAFDSVKNEFVDVSAPTDDTAAANPGRNANESYWKALYDTYDMRFNGVSHHSWDIVGNTSNLPAGFQYRYDATTVHANCVSGVGHGCGGLQSYYDGPDAGIAIDQTTNHENVTLLVEEPNCASKDQCSGWVEDGLFHDVQYLEKADGTVWEKFDNYIISDEGKVASWGDFTNITTGAEYKERMLQWNYQQIITASEFQGRKIDMVFEPKILIESGLIP